jgi:uncharacterized protein YvpB
MPSVTQRSAIARPMPDAAPVTTATLLRNSRMTSGYDHAGAVMKLAGAACIVLLLLAACGQPTAAMQAQTARLLDVPLHRQEHSLSCEAAALQMALGTLGREVAESDLLARLARDPTPRQVQPDGSVEWGDPELGFVGSLDGVFAQDGYGVYEQPIADLARAEGFPGSTPLKEADPEQVYDAVAAGYPVIIWIPYDGDVKGRGAWTTPAGEEIDYVVTEHAVVLAGVDEDGVTYADPYTATFQHMPFDRFQAAMAELGNRAVIVMP